MRPRRRSLLFHLKCNQWCATDEILFFQVNKEPETGFKRIAVGGKIGAIERVTHFESESVAGAEAAGFHSKFRANYQCVLPELGCNLCRKEDFESVFSGIPGSRNR